MQLQATRRDKKSAHPLTSVVLLELALHEFVFRQIQIPEIVLKKMNQAWHLSMISTTNEILPQFVELSFPPTARFQSLRFLPFRPFSKLLTGNSVIGENAIAKRRLSVT